MNKKQNHELSVADILERHDFNAIDRLIRFTQETMDYPTNPEVLAGLGSNWEPYLTESGERRLRPSARLRFEVAKEVANYQYAKKRTVEQQTKVDYNIVVTCIRYGDSALPSPPTVITIDNPTTDNTDNQ